MGGFPKSLSVQLCKLDLGVYGILEIKMMGFVMRVIGKWSKVVVFDPEPSFYYL